MVKRCWLGAVMMGGLVVSAGAQESVAEQQLVRPVSAREWTKEAKLWTARSCVGEAGFDAQEECLAIAWVYATRAQASRQSYVKVVKGYSAAVKAHEGHRRPWIRQLTLEAEQPKDWPNLSWRVHRYLWKKLLARLDRWARGLEPNPVEGANHYGSEWDAKRAHYVRRWKRLTAPEKFRNWFFDSTNTTAPRESLPWYPGMDRLQKVSREDFYKYGYTDYKSSKKQSFGIIYSGKQ